MRKILPILTVLLWPSLSFGGTQIHATDCTSLACDPAQDGELCYEEDADTLYVCEGTEGAGIWKSAAGADCTDSCTFTSTTVVDDLSIGGVSYCDDAPNFGNPDTTPSVAEANCFSTTGTQTIADFDDGTQHQSIYIKNRTGGTTYDCDGSEVGGGDLECGSVDLQTAFGDATWWTLVTANKWRLQAYYDQDKDYNVGVALDSLYPGLLFDTGAASDNDFLSYDLGTDSFDWVPQGEVRRVGIGIQASTPISFSSENQIGSYVFATGGVPQEYDLAGASIGDWMCFYAASGYAITIDPDASDNIVLNGVALSAGESIISPGNAGDHICIVAQDAATWNTFYAQPPLVESQESIQWNSSEWTVDGTHCISAIETLAPSSPSEIWDVTCAVNDAATANGYTMMPENWDGGDVQFSLSVHHAASESITCLYDATCQCLADGEAFSNTFTTESASTEISIATTTLANQMQSAEQSAAITCSGTCAAGNLLRWELEVDQAGSGANCANTDLVNLKMKYNQTQTWVEETP